MEHPGDKRQLKEVLKGFSKGVIAYYKLYAQITGSVTAGLLLSQIAYWWYGPAGEKPFFKTNPDFADELVMGDSELKTAKKQLVSLGFIGVTYKGVPPRTYYTFNESAVLDGISNWAKIAQLNGRKSPNHTGENRPIERAKIAQTCGRKSTARVGENRPPYKSTAESTINNSKEGNFRTARSFSIELNKIIPVSQNPAQGSSDWKSYEGVGRWITGMIIKRQATAVLFDKVIQIAIRAKNDTTRPDVKPIAKFFKIITDELGYQRHSKGGNAQTVGNIIRKMRII
ncbi:MAG: hypothetical protein ABSG22_10755 [Sedimentisphaerales bacterium]|jgi:hypothetical protein